MRLIVNHIGAEGALAISEALKLNTSLTSIVLWGEFCRAVALFVVSLFPHICVDNDIGDDGAIALSEALKVNTTLTSINIGGLLSKNAHLIVL